MLILNFYDFLLQICYSCLFFSFSKKYLWSRKRIQWLSTLADDPGDLSSVLSTHNGQFKSPVTPAPGDICPLVVTAGTCNEGVLMHTQK